MNDSRWRERAKRRYLQLKTTEGLTQAKLAEQVGVTQGAIAHWLSGRRQPDTLDQYESLARSLKMHPAELLYGLDTNLASAFDGFDSDKKTKVIRAIHALADVA